MGGDMPAELGWQLGDFNRRILSGAAMASQGIGRRFSWFWVVVCGFRYFVLTCYWYSDGGICQPNSAGSWGILIAGF